MYSSDLEARHRLAQFLGHARELAHLLRRGPRALPGLLRHRENVLDVAGHHVGGLGFLGGGLRDLSPGGYGPPPPIRIAERRSDVAGAAPDSVADIERLNYVVDEAIVIHKYFGAYLPTKSRKGLDYTLGQEAVDFGRKTGFDYMLFLHAEDSFASKGRIALQVLGVAGCVIGFCAPNIGGGGQLAYASLVDLHTGEVVWFNVLMTGTQVAGINLGDMRTPEGAAQMVERLLGRRPPPPPSKP